MFELTRAWPFLGDADVVFASLYTCAYSAGAKGRSFGVASSVIEDALCHRASDAVRSLVSSLSADSVANVVREIVSHIPENTALRAQLLFTVATALKPSAKEISIADSVALAIQRCSQWTTLARACGTPSHWASVDLIGPVLTDLQTMINGLLISIADDTVGLASLHAINRDLNGFAALSRALGASETVDTDAIAASGADLAEYDTLLTQARSFVTYFCRCGVAIDADSLRKMVQRLTAGYATTPVARIRGIFSDWVCVDDMPWLHALQGSELFLNTWRRAGDAVIRKLRLGTNPAGLVDSDMVLEVFAEVIAEQRAETPMRRMLSPRDIRVGSRVMNLRARGDVAEFEAGEVIALNDVPDPSDEAAAVALQAEVDAAMATAVAAAQAEENVGLEEIPGVPVVAPMRTLATVQWDVAGNCSPIDVSQVDDSFTSNKMQYLLDAALQAAQSTIDPDDRRRTVHGILSGQRDPPEIDAARDGYAAQDTDGDNIVLSQAQVAELLIPRARKDWSNLAKGVVSGTLSVALLRDNFARMTNIDRRENEIRLLLDTGDGNTPGSGGGSKVDASALAAPTAAIADYILCLRLRNEIPAYLKVQHAMARLCSVAEVDDPGVARLQSFHSLLQTAWDSQTLSELGELCSPVRQFFELLSPQQMDFFAALATDPTLLDWLLDHKETDAFNRLLQVCRPRTDDPRLLKAIASLVQVRTLMIEFLYSEGGAPGDPPYRVFADLIDAVRTVDLARGATQEHLEIVQASFS